MKQLRRYVQEESKKSPDFSRHLAQARAEVRLAVAIAQLREQRGMSQRELSRQTGIKQPQIARLEKGDQLPRLDTLWRLLTALGARLEIGPDGMLSVHRLPRRAFHPSPSKAAS